MDNKSSKSNQISNTFYEEYDDNEQINEQEIFLASDDDDDYQEFKTNLKRNDDNKLGPPTSIITEQLSVSSQKDPPKKKKDLLTLFKDYLEKKEDEFDFNEISKCSTKQISAYLHALLEYLYKNCHDVNFCAIIFYIIHRKSRYTIHGKASFTDASNELFHQEMTKIIENSNWNEIVIFGALLCELLPYNKPEHFEVAKSLNTWIMTLVTCSAKGIENGLIAFMLILNRLKKIFVPLSGSFGQLLEVLKILLKNGDFERKKSDINTFLSQVGYLCLEDYESLTPVKFKKETENSEKCKEFEIFLTIADDHALFNVAMFSDILDNEIVWFAVKFVEIAISEPQKMKYFAYTAYRFQQIINPIRKIAENVEKKLNEEIETLKSNNGQRSIPIMNLAKFFGECYMYEEELISVKTMNNLLSILSDLGETLAIATTLKLCGGLYKYAEEEKVNKFLEQLGDDGIEIEKEIKMFDDVEDGDPYLEYQKSRRFQPEKDAKMIGNLNVFLNELSRDKNVNFDYLRMYDFKHHEIFTITNIIIKELSKPSTNVIKLAQFYKSFVHFSVKLGKFIVELKSCLLDKIADIPIDRPDEMIKVGKLIGELRNLGIIEKYPQDKWLDMIESLKPKENVEILEIQLNGLKVMMYNLYVHEESTYMCYLKYIESIDTSDPKYPQKVKSKILQIKRNLIRKEFHKPSKIVFIKMRSGCRFDGIPSEIPELSSTEFDLYDFVKFYFMSATNNPFLTEKYLGSRKFLAIGQQGRKFGIILSKLIFDRFKTITDVQYFDEHEAVPTLKFILLTNSGSIYRENSIATFLQNILDFEDFEVYKEFFKTLIRMLKKSKLNIFPRADSHNIFRLLRKVNAKFVEIEDFLPEKDQEVDVWYIENFQGYLVDQNTSSSEFIEASQLVWSFTENYKENQRKRQKMPENSKTPGQNIDNLAQNFMYFTKNFHKIQNPECSDNKSCNEHNLQNTNQVGTKINEKIQNLPQIEQKLDISQKNSIRNDQNSASTDSKINQTISQTSTFNFKILPENSQNFTRNSTQNSSQFPQKTSKFPQTLQNSSQSKDRNSQHKNRSNRGNQQTKIEWNVTRGDLQDRSNLQKADLPNIKKRFDHNSPLYQGSSQK